MKKGLCLNLLKFILLNEINLASYLPKLSPAKVSHLTIRNCYNYEMNKINVLIDYPR